MKVINPIKGKLRITSGFGARKHPTSGRTQFHNGVDIAAAVGTPVYAPANGVIQSAWYDSKYGGGKSLVMANPVNRFGFAHLSKVLVKSGVGVKQGDKIALTGATGNVTGPHLHYTVSERKGIGNQEWEKVDPVYYLDLNLA